MTASEAAWGPPWGPHTGSFACKVSMTSLQAGFVGAKTECDSFSFRCMTVLASWVASTFGMLSVEKYLKL